MTIWDWADRHWLIFGCLSFVALVGAILLIEQAITKICIVLYERWGKR